MPCVGHSADGRRHGVLRHGVCATLALPPLAAAAANGHADILRILLDSGAVLVENSSGNTPLSTLCRSGGLRQAR